MNQINMPMIPRRKFLQLTGATLAGLSLSGSYGSPIPGKKRTLGVQLFTIPQMAEKDLKGTLGLLGEIGYREVEFFGPYDFSAPETIESWKPIAAQLGIKSNAFYGYTIAEVKKMLKDYGLKVPSVHLDLITLRHHLEPAMEAFALLDVKYVAIPSLRNQEERNSLDGFRRLAEEFNQIGKKMARYGLTFTYHNHGYEHWEKEGQTPMEILLRNTDPSWVAFEMDIFWMTAGGADPVQFLKSYPGRFKLMHIKDAAEKVRFSGDGSTPDQWMALFPKMADPGTGVFDIKSILAAADQSGTTHFYLERDLTADPVKTLKNSYAYLEKI